MLNSFSTKISLSFYLCLTSLFLILRLLLSFLPSFAIDMNAWLAWANRLLQVGPANFYHQEIFTHYTPGLLYLLLFLAQLHHLFPLLGPLQPLSLKLAATLADLITAFLIYRLVVSRSPKWALLAFFIYLLHPALVFISNVWGQLDSYLVLFLLLTLYLLVQKNQPLFSSFTFALAVLIKPQALSLLPVYAFLLSKKPAKIILYAFLIFALSLLVFSLPFFPHHPILGLPQLIRTMMADYPYTSLSAFNFWSLVGTWQSDQLTFFGFTYQSLGFALYLLAHFFIFFKISSQKPFALTALSLFAFFLFPTRIHERYLVPLFAFFLVYLSRQKSLPLLILYLFISLGSFLNLYYVYHYYQFPHQPNFLFLLVSHYFKFFSALMLIFFALSLLVTAAPKNFKLKFNL